MRFHLVEVVFFHSKHYPSLLLEFHCPLSDWKLTDIMDLLSFIGELCFTIERGDVCTWAKSV